MVVLEERALDADEGFVVVNGDDVLHLRHLRGQRRRHGVLAVEVDRDVDVVPRHRQLVPFPFADSFAINENATVLRDVLVPSVGRLGNPPVEIDLLRELVQLVLYEALAALEHEMRKADVAALLAVGLGVAWIVVESRRPQDERPAVRIHVARDGIAELLARLWLERALAVESDESPQQERDVLHRAERRLAAFRERGVYVVPVERRKERQVLRGGLLLKRAANELLLAE